MQIHKTRADVICVRQWTPSRSIARKWRLLEGTASDDGFVSVGTDNDTPVFAARSTEAWWKQVGQQR